MHPLAPQKFINPARLHCRYYLFLKRIWHGKDEQLPKQISLCWYCQTTLWRSVGTFVFWPLLLIGWLSNKTLGRLMNWNNPLINKFEGTRFARLVDKSQTGIANAPASASLIFGLISSASLIAIFGIGVLVFFGVNNFGWLVEKAGEILQFVTVGLGSGIFFAFYGLGWLFHAVGDATVWLYKFFTSPEVITVLLFLLKWAIIGGIGSYAFGLTMYKAHEAGWFNGILKRAADFARRRELRRKELDQIRAKAWHTFVDNLPPWECPNCTTTHDRGVYRCYNCSRRHPDAIERDRWWISKTWLGKSIRRFFRNEFTLPGTGHRFREIGIISLITGMFWAAKHRVCPTLLIMTESEQVAYQRTAAVENKKRIDAIRAQELENLRREAKMAVRSPVTDIRGAYLRIIAVLDDVSERDKIKEFKSSATLRKLDMDTRIVVDGILSQFSMLKGLEQMAKFDYERMYTMPLNRMAMFFYNQLKGKTVG